MINIGIVGATGYTGAELLRLLSMHPKANITVVTSDSAQGEAVSTVLPNLRGHVELCFEKHDGDQLKSCDLVFFATPNATAMHHVSALLAQDCRIIDLSADFRITDPKVWAHWYKEEHANPALLKEAVYGLPELNREKIKSAQLVANPGCYATAVTLGLLPAVKNALIDLSSIIADAKSGVSGAGKGPSLTAQFSEVAESFKAYGVSGHRHLPEIKQSLQQAANSDVGLVFVPHLVPMNRGIFATIYMTSTISISEIKTYYDEFYSSHQFVDVLPNGICLNTYTVRGTNMCQLALHDNADSKNTIILLSVIDNLVKGAAGQAIQNMNLMFGLDETMGLAYPGLVP